MKLIVEFDNKKSAIVNSIDRMTMLLNTNRCVDGSDDDDGVVELLAGLCRRGPMYDDEIFAVNYVADEIVGDASDFRLKIQTKKNRKLSIVDRWSLLIKGKSLSFNNTKFLIQSHKHS